jgi:uncharacterized protein
MQIHGRSGIRANDLKGPHIGLTNAWPMSLLVQAQTSEDDAEILECLDLVLNSSRLGLVHESIDVNILGYYTRPWFACKLMLLDSSFPKKTAANYGA